MGCAGELLKHCPEQAFTLHRWKNRDRDGAARNYRRAIGFGTDAAALARAWPTSLFAKHPSTHRPDQVPVSLLLSQRLSVTRDNLAVLERSASGPASSPAFPLGAFARATGIAASDAIPSLVEQLEHLSIAAGRVSGAACDACKAPRPVDTALKMCSICHLAACVAAPLKRCCASRA